MSLISLKYQTYPRDRLSSHCKYAKGLHLCKWSTCNICRIERIGDRQVDCCRQDYSWHFLVEGRTPQVLVLDCQKLQSKSLIKTLSKKSFWDKPLLFRFLRSPFTLIKETPAHYQPFKSLNLNNKRKAPLHFLQRFIKGQIIFAQVYQPCNLRKSSRSLSSLQSSFHIIAVVLLIGVPDKGCTQNPDAVCLRVV